jgi:uncharacterized membrane protein
LPQQADIGKSTPKMRLVDLICRPDARHRLVIGLAVGVATFFALHGHLWFEKEVIAGIAGFNASALVIVALDWLTILTTPQPKIRELAQQQDLSRFLIFVFVVVAACAALFAVGFLVSRPKEQTAGISLSTWRSLLNRRVFVDAGSYGIQFPLCPCVLWRRVGRGPPCRGSNLSA